MKLFGVDGQLAAFRAAASSERMHHAWLLAGARGIGKATFADWAAHLLLDAELPGSQSAKLMAARSHPDFRLVEREVWQKNSKDRLVPYDERKTDDLPARNIRLVQIRWLHAVLAMPPSLSTRRVIMIDAADDLERGAANAILKMLEEPPANTIFLLVSHQPGRLLPTIRSRCRTLMFDALSDDAMTSVLVDRLPEIGGEKRAELIASANGSPATAFAYAELDMATLDTALDELARTGDPTNAVRTRLAQSLSLKAAQPRYEAFLTRAPAFVAELARQAQTTKLDAALTAWSKARVLSQNAIPQSLVAETVVFELAGIVASLAPTKEHVKA